MTHEQKLTINNFLVDVSNDAHERAKATKKCVPDHRIEIRDMDPAQLVSMFNELPNVFLTTELLDRRNAISLMIRGA